MTCFKYHTWWYEPGSFVGRKYIKMKNMVFITEAHRLWGVRHIAIVHSNTGTTGVLGTETYPKL